MGLLQRIFGSSQTVAFEESELDRLRYECDEVRRLLVGQHMPVSGRKLYDCVRELIQDGNSAWNQVNELKKRLGTPCSASSPDTVVPPDQATWDILCAYLAGEEHHGAEISEGRLTEILKHRIGWGRDKVRAAWFDAVARGNALIEADHERVRPIAARLIAETEGRQAEANPGSTS